MSLSLARCTALRWICTSIGKEPTGKAMFQMLGVFAEFERAIIVQRVRAGLAKARAQGTRSGKAIGRPKVPAEKIAAVRAALAAGEGIRKVAVLRETMWRPLGVCLKAWKKLLRIVGLAGKSPL